MDGWGTKKFSQGQKVCSSVASPLILDYLPPLLLLVNSSKCSCIWCPCVLLLSLKLLVHAMKLNFLSEHSHFFCPCFSKGLLSPPAVTLDAQWHPRRKRYKGICRKQQIFEICWLWTWALVLKKEKKNLIIKRSDKQIVNLSQVSSV